MKRKIKIRLLALVVSLLTFINAQAVSLWVGQTYQWDFSGSILGSVYNMSVTSDGGYLSITGSGFYRNITPTQYFSGSATVTAEWDYSLYYGSSLSKQRVQLTVTCYENKVSISPTSVTLSPGQTYQLSYRHAYDNEYVGAANAYFSGGNESFSVTSSGLITAKSPGSGYVNVYSKLSSAANAPYCLVTVKEVEPSGASIGNMNLLADESKDLTVTVTPSNASVRSKEWYIKSGEDIVKISGQKITGLKKGTATIYCKVNGSIKSNDATVTVTEPDLLVASTNPESNSKDVSVFTNPSVTFSHPISQGDSYNSISMTTNGVAVNGTVIIRDRTLRYLFSKPLSPETEYKLYIPKNAIKNKWGNGAKEDLILTFRTGKLEKATLSLTPVSGSYLTKEETVSISATPSNAKIYFTTDGSDPSTSSQLYTEPFRKEEDFTVKAIAVCEGYEDSDIVTAEYFKSQSEILSYYPNDANPLFNYAWVSPYLKLSGEVEKSNNFRRISLTDDTGSAVSGEVFLSNYMIIFVPDEPLENCKKYTMDIPRNAVKTKNGENFKGYRWTFSTPVKPVSAAMRGDETVFVISENDSIQTRGMQYLSSERKDFEKLSPYDYSNKFASGYSHSILLKETSIKGEGDNYCGESTDFSYIEEVGEIKCLKSGLQTSAIIGEDNSLWMCGRNDFYQLGDSTGTTSNKYLKVAENIIDVALGNCFTLFVDKDNVLWGVGRNHLGQLGDGTTIDRMKPIKIKDGVSKVFASISGYFSACITTDGTLFTWGDNSSNQLGYAAGKYGLNPKSALDGVKSVALGEHHILAIKENEDLYSWGGNQYGQISSSEIVLDHPIKMDENIKSVAAGPNTSLLLFNSGKVTGWGKIYHNNFAPGYGKASGIVILDPIPYDSIQSLKIEPYRYEILPDNTCALVAIPVPLAADFDNIEWSSSNPEIASVAGNGIITTTGLGEATITAQISDKWGRIKKASAKIVCTNSPDNSEISSLSNPLSMDAKIYSMGKDIIIEDAITGRLYDIYNTQGVKIGTVRIEKERSIFTVNIPGIYLITSHNHVTKLICK